uniref:Uncharacterized protein n=1 Tax=Quercus lobata TaxID=97700 RepID=A0A7N2M175_QUELO
MVGYIQRGLLFVKPTSSQEKQLDEENNMIDHLASSFSRALDIFYPLAGRLAMIENNEDDTASFFIDCNNQGAQFVHAAADGITVADILEPIDDPQIVDSLLLMNNVLNYEGISTPIAGRARSHLCKQWWVFWRSMPRSRCLDSDEKVWCIIGLGTRHRMQPPLPKQNFWNAVHGELVTSTARELIEHGLGWAGWRINNTITSKTTQEVRKYLDDWVKNPKVVNQSPLTSASLLILGSSPWFDIYGNDFGWGKPVAQRGSGHEFDGMLVVSWEGRR